MDGKQESSINSSNEKDAVSLEETTQKRKRNSSALSYVAVIAQAILSSPHQRLTLSEIYQFIEKQHPRFTENRARWKHTVRHNLSLHDCFVRGEVAMNKKGCNWRIHPSFIAEFSRGNFSRHKLSQSPSLPMEIRYERLHGNQLPATPSIPCSCYICSSTARFLPSSPLLQFPRRELQYMQLPPYSWNPWIYWSIQRSGRVSTRN